MEKGVHFNISGYFRSWKWKFSFLRSGLQKQKINKKEAEKLSEIYDGCGAESVYSAKSMIGHSSQYR